MNKVSESLKALVYVVVLLAALMYITSSVTSKYTGMDITVKAKPGSIPENDIKNLPSKLECVPGSDPKADYYTRSLTPGGICNGQAFVVASSNYEITGGIGEPLMSQQHGDDDDDGEMAEF